MRVKKNNNLDNSSSLMIRTLTEWAPGSIPDPGTRSHKPCGVAKKKKLMNKNK